MQLRKLRYFIAVAQELSIRRAARQLGVAQSALTRQIATLEAELGLDLFIRDRRRIVSLTAAGENFFSDARRIVAELDRATNSAREIATGKEGTLRLGICEDAATERLSRILAAFRERLPNLNLELFDLPSPSLVRALGKGDIDLALLVPPVHDHTIVVDPLWRDDWLLALPEGHKLAERNRIEPEDLADIPLILANPDLEPCGHDQIKAAFEALSIVPRIAAQPLRRTTMLYLVSAGSGVTFLPGSMAAVSIPGVVMRPFAAEPMTIAAAYRVDPPGLAMRFLRVAQRALAPEAGLNQDDPTRD